MSRIVVVFVALMSLPAYAQYVNCFQIYEPTSLPSELGKHDVARHAASLAEKGYYSGAKNFMLLAGFDAETQSYERLRQSKSKKSRKKS